MQIPFLSHTAATYILDAANNHLPGYAGLTQGAAELIIHFATKELNQAYVPNMLSGQWGGTMCLTASGRKFSIRYCYKSNSNRGWFL